MSNFLQLLSMDKMLLELPASSKLATQLSACEVALDLRVPIAEGLGTR